MPFGPPSEEGATIIELRRLLDLASVQIDGYRLRLGELERALVKLEARCNRLAIDNLRMGRELARRQGNSEQDK